MKNGFFAMILRMKYINRWGLMRNTRAENLSEHSLDVAILAHALAIIKNKYFGGNLNPDKIAVAALFHDTSEIITGDLPTPIKYQNEEIKEAYKKVEEDAVGRLLSLLPDDLKELYSDYYNIEKEDTEASFIVKSADKLSAYIKCLEEQKSGNSEFEKARIAIEQNLKVRRKLYPELDYFMNNYLDAFKLTLDELEGN
ncbi:MAG: 5'-deoxynucleotidase [Oscillospiraceae bacterium]|nr:5'-deoxynucleotidase [Oscillospiraceae bacterium]